jgi:formylglycine-generating enzyme required for sulfatase activity
MTKTTQPEPKTNQKHIPLEMVYIPGGEFMMGSCDRESNSDERPQHLVRLKAFYMSKYPITQRQYQAVMGENPSRFKGDDRPVDSVSWYKAKEFCQRLSDRTKKPYSLPSESQWEYACRANSQKPFAFGDIITTDVVNYNGRYSYVNAPKEVCRPQTTDVGTFPANAFGVYDMHGNVWEWCEDDWYSNYHGYHGMPSDGSPWVKRSNNVNIKVMRGGSWDSSGRLCRSAFRDSCSPDVHCGNVGFRLTQPTINY